MGPSLLEGTTTWIFSSCGRCSRPITGTSGNHSGGLRKCQSRGKSRGARFTPPSSRGGILSLRGRERIPGVPVASQEEALSTGKPRGTQASCHHSQSPPDVLVYSRETCFPCSASTFKPRIDSHHGCTWDNPVGKPGGKASRESLEGKPQIP